MKFILSKSLFLLTVISFLGISSFAQNKITGTIIDTNNNDILIGASILISGTSVGTVTNASGQYTLSSNK